MTDIEPASVVRPAVVDQKGACAYTGLSRTTLWERTVAGDLISVKSGRRRLYRLVDLDDFLARHIDTNPTGARR